MILGAYGRLPEYVSPATLDMIRLCKLYEWCWFWLAPPPPLVLASPSKFLFVPPAVLWKPRKLIGFYAALMCILSVASPPPAPLAWLLVAVVRELLLKAYSLPLMFYLADCPWWFF